MTEESDTQHMKAQSGPDFGNQKGLPERAVTKLRADGIRQIRRWQWKESQVAGTGDHWVILEDGRSGRRWKKMKPGKWQGQELESALSVTSQPRQRSRANSQSGSIFLIVFGLIGQGHLSNVT